MLIKVAFQSTMETGYFSLDSFRSMERPAPRLFFSTPVGPRGVDVMAELGENA